MENCNNLKINPFDENHICLMKIHLYDGNLSL